MNILCRLGLHSWKPVMRRVQVELVRIGGWWLDGRLIPYRLVPRFEFQQTGCKCRRCGKRVTL